MVIKKKKPVKRQAERRTTSWKWNVKIKIKILSIFLFSLLSRKIERWTVEAKTGRQTESSGREEEEDHSSKRRQVVSLQVNHQPPLRSHNHSQKCRSIKILVI
jgi:hypothetical protein